MFSIRRPDELRQPTLSDKGTANSFGLMGIALHALYILQGHSIGCVYEAGLTEAWNRVPSAIFFCHQVRSELLAADP